MTKFQDLTLWEDEETSTPMDSSSSTSGGNEGAYLEQEAPRGEKQFIKYEGGEVIRVNEYVRTLNFNQRLHLLFGKDLPESPKNEEPPKMSPEGDSGKGPGLKRKIIMGAAGILVMLTVFQLASLGVKSLREPKNPLPVGVETGAEIDAEMELLMATEWQNITRTVRSEIDLYNMEEYRKIQDYLDIRANRGSTLTSIKIQLAKKENTYLYLVQNKGFFRDKAEEYTELENRVVKAIALSQRAVDAFEARNTATILRSLVRSYRQ